MYMATPIGPALAQITEQHLHKGRAVSAAFPVLLMPPLLGNSDICWHVVLNGNEVGHS